MLTREKLDEMLEEIPNGTVPIEMTGGAVRELITAAVVGGALRELVEAIVIENRCGDGSCHWGRPGGMHTNGGCRDDKMSHTELRRKMRGTAMALRAALDQTK